MGYRSMRPSLFLLTLLLAGCTSSAISVSSSLSSSTTSVGSSVTSSSTSSIPDDYPFTPGERGSVPVDPALVPISGQFGGLYIEQMDHQPYFYGEGTRAEAVLRFPEPYEIEATQYRLQTYATSTSSWVNYGEGDDFLLDYDNCIVPAINEQRFRLLVIGGPRDGDVSNEVVTSYPTVETQFMGYYLDESMSLTGIMSPFVGRGLEASFPVKSHATGLEVTTGLNYQWYRVNPFTYAHTPIAGATALSYTTTMADLGFYIAIIATGDGVNVGGSYEVISRGNPIMLPVATFVTDGTSTSFQLHFQYRLPSIDIESLDLRDDTFTSLTIASAVLSPDKASATIALAEPTSSNMLFLSCFDHHWAYVSQSTGMSVIEIEIP